MVSRKALQCRMEPRRTQKDNVVTSVVSNVEDGTGISGGKLGILMALRPALNKVNQ